MKKTTIVIAILWIVFGALYTLFSIQIKNTELIWILTRFMGLLSYLFLFLTIVIGELRMITKIKANFKIFALHVPFAIFTMFLIFLHGVASVADNYKWGKGLSFFQYLGFSFSDKWLMLLSLGTLAFYLIVLVGISSHKRIIQFMGFKNWKLFHHLSYIAFIMGYIHSRYLGTDLKDSFLAPILRPLFLLCLLIVISLFVTKIFIKISLLSDQFEINLVAICFMVLIIGTIFILATIITKRSHLNQLEYDLEELKSTDSVSDKEIQKLIKDNSKIQSEIDSINNEIKSTGSKIKEVKNE